MTVPMPRWRRLPRDELKEIPLEESIRQVRWKKRKRRQTYSRLERIMGMIDR